MELVNLLKNAGIVGAGGAGFPSYAKIAEGADTLLVNGSECEPLLYTDYIILKNEISLVLNGIKTVLSGTSIKKAVLAIKEHTAKRLSFSDGERLADAVSIKVLPDVYPIGDEISFIYQALGRSVKPGALPISVGVIVYNVETMYNLGVAEKFGTPVTKKWLTVGGDIERPLVIRVAIGTPVSHIFRQLNIDVDDEHTVLDGGPSMGKVINPSVATVGKTTKAILILPSDIPAVKSKLTDSRLAVSRAETACCQCTRCTDMCPRNLLGYPLEPHKMVRTAMAPIKAEPVMVLSATLCCGCGICETLACSQGISPKAVINNYKQILAKSKLKYTNNSEISPKREREYRMVSSEKWMSSLGVSRFDRVPEYFGDIETDRVVIQMRSHIGAPSVPTVNDGKTAFVGELIAEAGAGLSVPQHASIDGVVSVYEDKITIDKVSHNV